MDNYNGKHRILVAYLSLGGEQGENKRDNIQLLSRQVIYVYIVLYTTCVCMYIYIYFFGQYDQLTWIRFGMHEFEGNLHGNLTETHTITSYTLTHSEIWENSTPIKTHLDPTTL